jgi:FAD:protein FMN transferase
MNRHAFEAMGTTIVVGGAREHERRAIEGLFAEWERIFSPFRPDSELSAVNRASGRLVQVSPLFAETVTIALRAARSTEGMVDPTLGVWPQVRVIGRLVQVPEGVSLDLNGVVKSLAVDAALEYISGEGYVSGGGDLASRGALTVELPQGGSVLLRRGALATSGTSKRGRHLIDVRTRRPSDSPWREVTACGATCLDADVAAKAGFLAGEGGSAWLDRRGIPARFISQEGDVTCNDAWRTGVREPEAVCI